MIRRQIRQLHNANMKILSQKCIIANACYILLPGEETEAAFRARHRWAARRVAHLLRGLPDKPPLQSVSELIESASVNVGLVINGQPFLGSSVDFVSAAGGLEGTWQLQTVIGAASAMTQPL